jgi:hypothetical protein
VELNIARKDGDCALGFRSFRKPQILEVILEDIEARLGGPTEPPHSSTVQGFREPTSEGENGAMDGKHTSELSKPSSGLR